nr:MAG TPA: hypothetical protein [Caudoviricetes sp.]
MKSRYGIVILVSVFTTLLFQCIMCQVFHTF